MDDETVQERRRRKRDSNRRLKVLRRGRARALAGVFRRPGTYYVWFGTEDVAEVVVRHGESGRVELEVSAARPAERFA